MVSELFEMLDSVRDLADWGCGLGYEMTMLEDGRDIIPLLHHHRLKLFADSFRDHVQVHCTSHTPIITTPCHALNNAF